jgi:adenylate kinase family enzyme
MIIIIFNTMAINLTRCITKVSKTIIKDWRDYCRGMAEYARFNNVGSNRENSWQSIVNETNECKQAFQQGQMTETIHEFIDVVHALIKHLVVTYLPSEWYCKSYFWIIVFPLVFPVAVKLAHRYQQFGCIRNHKNPNNCGHICSLRKHPLKIYYAVSVRGSDSLVTKQDVVTQIEFLKGLGDVMTEHLGSSDPLVVDMQGASDEDIFIKDMKLITDCDVFIADVTASSLGVGFVIGEALHLNKPVFCLHKQPGYGQRKKLSAMINGHPLVAKSDYFDQTTYEISIKRFLVDLHERSLLPAVELKSDRSNAMKIFLAGPPGSGKSTVGKSLAQKWGFVFISSGDICRQIVKDRSHPLAQKVRSFMDQGHLVPASVMKELISDRLKQSDCQTLGYVLDGYPPSQDDLDNLLQEQIQPDLLFLFKCEDATAVARQCSRGDRITDEFSAATQRVALFHQNLPNFCKFKDTPVITVDADQTAEVVDSYVKSTVRNWIDPPKTSYFPIPPTANQSLLSTRFHFHIDANDNKQLREITKLVYASYPDLAGQMKIYPIQSLHLGQQTQDLPAYGRMANFHEISNSKTEAFMTGRMGLEYNSQMMSAVLQSCRNSRIGSAAELEQYLGEWQRTPDGTEIVDSQYEEQIVELPQEFSQYLIADVPIHELHHGFNILKSNFPNQPIYLEDLTMRCNEKGFHTGGWFIFSNNDHWSYRSNEFSNLTSSEARKLLGQQAIDLQSILFNWGYDDVNVMYSLERVHGIYRFDNV